MATGWVRTVNRWPMLRLICCSIGWLTCWLMVSRWWPMVTASNNNQQDGHHQRLDELITMATGFVAMVVPTDHPTIDTTKVSTSFRGATFLRTNPSGCFKKKHGIFPKMTSRWWIRKSGMALASPTNQIESAMLNCQPPDALAAVGNGAFGGSAEPWGDTKPRMPVTSTECHETPPRLVNLEVF